MGIPAAIELISMFAGSALGGAMSLWAKKQEYRQQSKVLKHEHEMAVLGRQSEMVKEARESKVMESSWVRRTIALIGIFFVIAWPKIVPLFTWKDIPVAVSYSVIHPENFFRNEKESVEWTVVDGVAITPLDTTIVFAIVGLYFGYEIVRKAHR